MLARVSLRIGLPPVTDVCPYDAYPTSCSLALGARATRRGREARACRPAPARWERRHELHQRRRHREDHAAQSGSAHVELQLARRLERSGIGFHRRDLPRGGERSRGRRRPRTPLSIADPGRGQLNNCRNAAAECRRVVGMRGQLDNDRADSEPTVELTSLFDVNTTTVRSEPPFVDLVFPPFSGPSGLT
jgi:hypothetical protein